MAVVSAGLRRRSTRRVSLALRIPELPSIVGLMVDLAPPPGAGRDGRIADAHGSAAWDAFVAASEPGSYLQLSGWARVKAVNGWTAHRVAADAARAPVGAQILVRRPRPMPWASPTPRAGP